MNIAIVSMFPLDQGVKLKSVVKNENEFVVFLFNRHEMEK